MPQTLVTKSTYAVMRNRTPAAVTHWINDGKLTAPALVMQADGSQLIDADLADAQLAITLHPSQQAAQAAPIAAPSSSLPADPAGADAGEDPRDPPGDASAADNVRFNRYRADRMQAEAEGLARKRQEEAGKWVEADAARQAFARELSTAIVEVEAWLTPTAEIAAAELGVDRKALLVILRREFRAFRTRQATAKGAAAPVAPEEIAQAAE